VGLSRSPCVFKCPVFGPMASTRTPGAGVRMRPCSFIIPRGADPSFRTGQVSRFDPQGSFEIGRGGRLANSDLGNGNFAARDLRLHASPTSSWTALSRRRWCTSIRRVRWGMTISFARHQFPPAITRVRRSALRAFHTQSSRYRRSARGARSGCLYETVRRWVLKLGPVFARGGFAVRSAKSHT
jgi:hypothetical protein